MNSKKIQLLLYIIVCVVNLNAQKNVKKLEIFASAILEDKKTDNYSIITYLDGVVKDSIFCNHTKSNFISFDENKVYTLVFKKDNYPQRAVVVNTRNPYGIREIEEMPFNFLVEFSPEKSTIKNELSDYPAAILIINKNERSLISSESYYKFTHTID